MRANETSEASVSGEHLLPIIFKKAQKISSLTLGEKPLKRSYVSGYRRTALGITPSLVEVEERVNSILVVAFSRSFPCITWPIL